VKKGYGDGLTLVLDTRIAPINSNLADASPIRAVPGKFSGHHVCYCNDIKLSTTMANKIESPSVSDRTKVTSYFLIYDAGFCPLRRYEASEEP
jgi:hypothetical protein